MDAGRFPRRQDASSENPAGSADPVQSTGRAGRGVLSLRQVSLHKQRKVARAVTARKPLILILGVPGQQAGQDPPCEAVTGDVEKQERLAALAPSSALRAPSPASGRRAGVAQGGQAGGAFFAPGFFAQAKKGGSRRHGAKALDLDVGERAAGQDPPYGALAKSGGSRPALRGFGGTAGRSGPAL